MTRRRSPLLHPAALTAVIVGYKAVTLAAAGATNALTASLTFLSRHPVLALLTAIAAAVGAIGVTAWLSKRQTDALAESLAHMDELA